MYSHKSYPVNIYTADCTILMAHLDNSIASNRLHRQGCQGLQVKDTPSSASLPEKIQHEQNKYMG